MSSHTFLLSTAFFRELESLITLLSMIKVNNIEIMNNKFIIIFFMSLLAHLCGYSQPYINPITNENST